MKIGHNPDTANALTQAAAAKQQAKAPAPAAQDAAKDASRTAAAGVPVTLSQAARSMDVARGASDFDAGKVKAVKSAIEKGTFKVDAEAVADKLLANASETLLRSRG
jgi:negative regulator of flagellin synthesis FlgM